MVRIQVRLTEPQARWLRARARRRGFSAAELIRRFVEKGLSEDDPERALLYERAAAIVGHFPDKRGATDLARRHDSYLAEAFD